MRDGVSNATHNATHNGAGQGVATPGQTCQQDQDCDGGMGTLPCDGAAFEASACQDGAVCQTARYMSTCPSLRGPAITAHPRPAAPGAAPPCRVTEVVRREHGQAPNGGRPPPCSPTRETARVERDGLAWGGEGARDLSPRCVDFSLSADTRSLRAHANSPVRDDYNPVGQREQGSRVASSQPGRSPTPRCAVGGAVTMVMDLERETLHSQVAHGLLVV